MKRALLIVSLATVANAALCADSGPLPGEIVTRVGQVAAIPADVRKVPGFAGAWRPADAQDKVVERIGQLEARATPSCERVTVLDTAQAAPDLIETRPNRAHHSLERWTVDACGTRKNYNVWYRFERNASRLVVVEAHTGDFQAELDPPYRRLLELAAIRQRDEASGRVRWLNLPLPADTIPAASSPAPSGKTGAWSADFVPAGQTIRDWTELISIQGYPRSRSPDQARNLLESMQAVRASRCGVSATPIEALRWGNGADGDILQTTLLCPLVPDTNFAEFAVVKAIEGPDALYVIQRAWRVPSADEASLRAASRGPQAAAEGFLAQVRLCDPAHDARNCPAPFPH